MNILILGQNGQLGRDLSRKLSPHHNVISHTRRDFDFEKDRNFTQYFSSLCERFGSIDYVINCVAMTNTGLCETEIQKAFLLNGLILKEICDALNQKQTHLIHISTDYVFDGKTQIPYREDAQCHPLSIYGHSKRCAEELIQTYSHNATIIRTSSLYGISGASGKGGNFIETMINLSKSKDSLTVISDQTMSPTWTWDLTLFIDKILSQENTLPFDIFHFSNQGHCSWYEFTVEIFNLLQISTPVFPISYKNFPTPLERPNWSVFNLEKSNSLMMIPHWKESLKKYLESKHPRVSQGECLL